jgi:glycyl-tRNA synthetase
MTYWNHETEEILVLIEYLHTQQRLVISEVQKKLETMKNLYNKNGLIFWTEKEIKLRRMLEEYFTQNIQEFLKTMNPAFEMMQVEAPVMMPTELVSSAYTEDDVFRVNDELTLRAETTLGSFLYAQDVLNKHNDRKVRMPLCIWQHGKSFRNEQDKTVSNMRLKEFYQLEYQIIYSKTTSNDYYGKIVPFINELVTKIVDKSRIELSDRLPSYSEITTDIIINKNDMEVCSISKRTDFDNALVVEIAIGTDRCVYNFNNR